MDIFMDKEKRLTREAWIKDILANEEKFFNDIKNSPAVLRKNEEAARQLAQLKPPFPWQKDAFQPKE